MLKSIVEHEPIDPMFRQNRAALVPVRADPELHFSREPFAQQGHFVALWLATRSCASRSSIPARQNRRVLPFLGKSLRDRQDHGRLARASHGKISHAEYC